MEQRIAYLDCHSGISGDMFLGAMLDAGLPFATLQAALRGLSITGFDVRVSSFQEKGIRGSRFEVIQTEQEQPARHLSDILQILRASTLAPRARKMATAVFSRLAEAEAAVHGTTIEEVHFHEVGAIDAIVDITGAAIAIDTLGIEALYASPLPLSSGHVKTAHGLLPVPAPATLELLRQAQAPWKPVSAEGEMVTPTGAAILAALARFETPTMRIEQVGYGFGRKTFPWPNCLRACLGTPLSIGQQADGDAFPESDWVTVIETNIDNMPGELLGGVMERLLAAGALDVSYSPLYMKKNRPAVLLSVICLVEDAEALAGVLLRETSTLGVRMQQMQRRKAMRAQQYIETPFGPMTIKVKLLGARVISAAPEYEECRRVAQARNIPLEEVYEVAQQVIARTIITTEQES